VIQWVAAVQDMHDVMKDVASYGVHAMMGVLLCGISSENDGVYSWGSCMPQAI
jgi:hypothetical protein